MSLEIDHMQQISGVVVPPRIVAHILFIQDATLALLRNVRDPYSPYTKTMSLYPGK